MRDASPHLKSTARSPFLPNSRSPRPKPQVKLLFYLNLTSSLNRSAPLLPDNQTMPSKSQPTSEELLDEPPTSIDPYQVLDLEKDATPDKIKSAYRKAALQCHPGMNKCTRVRCDRV